MVNLASKNISSNVMELYAFKDFPIIYIIA